MPQNSLVAFQVCLSEGFSLLYKTDPCRNTEIGRRRPEGPRNIRSSHSDCHRCGRSLDFCVLGTFSWSKRRFKLRKIFQATFCIWERDWNYLVAFYFFFISLRYELKFCTRLKRLYVLYVTVPLDWAISRQHSRNIS